MERVIKFRAKSKNGHWEFGYPFFKYDSWCIIVSEEVPPTYYEPGGDWFYGEYEIDPKTLGQFTGLHDAHDEEIYEGDILSVHQFLFDGTEVEKEWIGKVVYIYCGFGLKVISGEFALSHTGYKTYDEMEPIPMSFIYGLHEQSFRVIGNTYENPELLTQTKI